MISVVYFTCTLFCSSRSSDMRGKKLTATVTASNGGCVRGTAAASGGKPGKPGTARLMGGRSILVERHGNDSSDRATAPADSHVQVGLLYH